MGFFSSNMAITQTNHMYNRIFWFSLACEGFSLKPMTTEIRRCSHRYRPKSSSVQKAGSKMNVTTAQQILSHHQREIVADATYPTVGWNQTIQVRQIVSVAPRVACLDHMITVESKSMWQRDRNSALQGRHCCGTSHELAVGLDTIPCAFCWTASSMFYVSTTILTILDCPNHQNQNSNKLISYRRTSRNPFNKNSTWTRSVHGCCGRQPQAILVRAWDGQYQLP